MVHDVVNGNVQLLHELMKHCKDSPLRKIPNFEGCMLMTLHILKQDSFKPEALVEQLEDPGKQSSLLAYCASPEGMRTVRSVGEGLSGKIDMRQFGCIDTIETV